MSIGALSRYYAFSFRILSRLWLPSLPFLLVFAPRPRPAVRRWRAHAAPCLCFTYESNDSASIIYGIYNAVANILSLFCLALFAVHGMHLEAAWETRPPESGARMLENSLNSRRLPPKRKTKEEIYSLRLHSPSISSFLCAHAPSAIRSMLKYSRLHFI